MWVSSSGSSRPETTLHRSSSLAAHGSDSSWSLFLGTVSCGAVYLLLQNTSSSMVSTCELSSTTMIGVAPSWRLDFEMDLLYTSLVTLLVKLNFRTSFLSKAAGLFGPFALNSSSVPS
ncbi:unnamed protein product [Heterotrigona itama]|uniref:Uncharacterized protein n=1 Tax=Heterotrigona itama TaxID=395501 RepID=A0A6V7H0B3_9HYME|nr:unnamed protein product [Heterotrigona itama]